MAEMKIQKFDVVLDEDGKNILTENFSMEYTGVKDASRPEWIAAVMNGVFGLSEKAEEYMYLICVTSSCRPIGFFELAHGTHNAALVGVREIFIRALLCGAAGIVLAHNHPGGLPNPSREDVSVTDKVRAASEFIGVQLYDHIIVGRDSWFSFAKEGKLAVALPEISDYNDNRQMRDFACKDAKDIHYQELAEGVRHFKEEKGGREVMCQAVEEYANEVAKRAVEEYANEVAKKTAIRTAIKYGIEKERIISDINEEFGISGAEAEKLYEAYAQDTGRN